MTERGLILNNLSNYSLETTTTNNDTGRVPQPAQTLLDFSWRNQNIGYVVGQHNNKTIPEKKFNIKSWIRTISTYIWTFVILAQKIWKCLHFIFKTPTKKWIQYQTVHYYTSSHLSPVSTHLLR